MARKSISGNETLAKQIKDRRIELHLTIEEAATRAGVGTKTWCRYEAGESIRIDKCKGICKALNWRGLPDNQNEKTPSLVEEYKTHEACAMFWRASILAARQSAPARSSRRPVMPG